MAAYDHLQPHQFKGNGTAMPDSSRVLSSDENAQYTHLFDQAHARQREVDELEELFNDG